jgi:hypothetical protein
VARLMARLPLPRRAHTALLPTLQSVTFFLLCLGFALLDLGCLYLFIVPQLRG